MQVFLTSPWVPPEWIKAHGLEPRGIWSAKDFSFEALPLSAGVCAFAEAAVRFAEAHSESATVFTTHCDQLRRGFDAIAGPARTRAFLFNLPSTRQTPAARRLYASELERLGGFLVRLGGQSPRAEALANLLDQYTRARTRLLEAAPSATALQFAEAVAEFHWSGPAATPPDLGLGTLDHGIPVALIGGPLPRARWGLLEFIKRCGGRVVLNGTEAGERSLLETPSRSLTRADPLEMLTETYIGGCADVFQRPNTSLYSWLKERLAARHVRGILLWHYVGCDLWRAEAQSLREAFGLPVLLLDADESPADSPRNAGRVQAFLEGLRA